MVRIARVATCGGRKTWTPICRVEKSSSRRTMNVHLWKFFISSANFDGLEWRKKRSGLKRNYMKPRWLAVSSRPRTKPTRSTVQNFVSTDGHYFLTMVLPAVLLTTNEQRTGL